MKLISNFVNKKDLDAVFAHYLEVKSKSGLVFYDTHVHPLEVLGVCCGGVPQMNTGPSLLEKLNFSQPALFVLEKLFQYTPKYIDRSICSNFIGDSRDVLAQKFRSSGVDRGVVIPIAPIVTVDMLNPYKGVKEFDILGSIDIHAINAEKIENEIIRQKHEYGIRGIKLHPNIQKFHPVPAHNDELTAEKITSLYKAINKHKLYVLFHAGYSYLPTNEGYEKVQYARLENFFSATYDLFSYFDVPVVLAHLGSYNVTSPNYELIADILGEHSNVYLDTAGVNSESVVKVMGGVTSERIIFGSDARYFDTRYSISRTLLSMKNGSTGLSDRLIAGVFSENYTRMLASLE